MAIDTKGDTVKSSDAGVKPSVAAAPPAAPKAEEKPASSPAPQGGLGPMQRMVPADVSAGSVNRERLMRLVATEADHKLAKTHPDIYAAQVKGIADVVLNRLAHPDFPKTMKGVADQKNQFSAINGPTGRNYTVHGSVDNVPASAVPQAMRDVLDKHLDDRLAGAPSTVGGATHYANPHYSDASNRGWINGLNDSRVGVGSSVHYHGNAFGTKPVEGVLNPNPQPTVVAGVDKPERDTSHYAAAGSGRGGAQVAAGPQQGGGASREPSKWAQAPTLRSAGAGGGEDHGGGHGAPRRVASRGHGGSGGGHAPQRYAAAGGGGHGGHHGGGQRRRSGGGGSAGGSGGGSGGGGQGEQGNEMEQLLASLFGSGGGLPGFAQVSMMHPDGSVTLGSVMGPNGEILGLAPGEQPANLAGMTPIGGAGGLQMMAMNGGDLGGMAPGATPIANLNNETGRGGIG